MLKMGWKLSNILLGSEKKHRWCCSKAWYFNRADVALPGFHRFFSDSSKEEREHAEKMMKYQNDRGGIIILQPIAVRNASYVLSTFLHKTYFT